MTALEYIPLDHIRPNPWQTRLAEDADHVAELADSIAKDGLLQIPLGRRLSSPAQGEGQGVELAFGHSRYAAYRFLHEAFGPAGNNTRGNDFAAFPIEIRDLTDRQMAEHAITENAHRKDLSAIEKARAIQHYQRDFGASQAEVGRLFNIQSQGGVSNLLKLLRLPEKVQRLIIDRSLPERLARQLVPFCHAFPADVLRIAQEVAGAASEAKDDLFFEHIETLLRRKAEALYNKPWPSPWPESPLSVDIIGGHKSLRELPACLGCEFHIGRRGREDGWCVRKECFLAKRLAWCWLRARECAQALKLTVARPGEKVSLIFAGEEDKLDRARRALAGKHDSLRIVPYLKNENNSWYQERNRRDLLGDQRLALASTNPQALYKTLPAAKKKMPAAQSSPDPSARWKKKEDERKRKVAVANALIRRVVPSFAMLLPKAPRVLDFLALALDESLHDVDSGSILKASTPAQKRERMAAELLDQMLDTYDPNIDEIRERLVETASRLKIKLPAQWDIIDAPATSPAPARKKAAKK